MDPRLISIVVGMAILNCVCDGAQKREKEKRNYEPSMQSLPMRTTGQERLHSWRHFLGLHLSLLTMAIRVILSALGAAAERQREMRKKRIRRKKENEGKRR